MCLPLVSHSGSGCSHDFLHFSPICLSFASRLSSTLGRVGRMIPSLVSHLSFICLPLGSHSGSCWSHDFLHLSSICLSFASRLSSTLGLVGRMIPSLVSHLSFICLPLVSHSGSCWSHDFLHLSSIGLSFVSTCLPLWVWLVA